MEPHTKNHMWLTWNNALWSVVNINSTENIPHEQKMLSAMFTSITARSEGSKWRRKSRSYTFFAETGICTENVLEFVNLVSCFHVHVQEVNMKHKCLSKETTRDIAGNHTSSRVV